MCVIFVRIECPGCCSKDALLGHYSYLERARKNHPNVLKQKPHVLAFTTEKSLVFFMLRIPFLAPISVLLSALPTSLDGAYAHVCEVGVERRG